MRLRRRCSQLFFCCSQENESGRKNYQTSLYFFFFGYSWLLRVFAHHRRERASWNSRRFCEHLVCLLNACMGLRKYLRTPVNGFTVAFSRANSPRRHVWRRSNATDNAYDRNHLKGIAADKKFLSLSYWWLWWVISPTLIVIGKLGNVL